MIDRVFLSRREKSKEIVGSNADQPSAFYKMWSGKVSREAIDFKSSKYTVKSF